MRSHARWREHRRSRERRSPNQMQEPSRSIGNRWRACLHVPRSVSRRQWGLGNEETAAQHLGHLPYLPPQPALFPRGTCFPTLIGSASRTWPSRRRRPPSLDQRRRMRRAGASTYRDVGTSGVGRSPPHRPFDAGASGGRHAAGVAAGPCAPLTSVIHGAAPQTRRAFRSTPAVCGHAPGRGCQVTRTAAGPSSPRARSPNSVDICQRERSSNARPLQEEEA